MDIARPDLAIARRKKRIRWAIAGVVTVVVATVGLSMLKPAVPTIERGLVWIDSVKRGPLVRQVRGTGTLVPEDIRWILSRTTGRVERIVLRPGAKVSPDSVIVVLSNPDTEQTAVNAEANMRVGEAELENLKFQLQSDVLSAEAAAYSANASYEQARLTAEANRILYEQHLITEIDFKKSEFSVESTRLNSESAQKKLEVARDSVQPRLAAKEASVDVLRNQARMRREEFEALNVKAGMDGVLQVMNLELGAQVGANAQLARVADLTHLKAQIRVAETQAKDVQIGQTAQVDTRNGIVEARVARVDPAVQGGTVAVDLEIVGDLPRGARPDLTVDGVIELERLDNVLYTGRPAFGQEMGTVGMFRLDDDGVFADRVPVKLGRSSVSNMEIVSGLDDGDQVILSDTSQFDAVQRIRLR